MIVLLKKMETLRNNEIDLKVEATKLLMAFKTVLSEKFSVSEFLSFGFKCIILFIVLIYLFKIDFAFLFMFLLVVVLFALFIAVRLKSDIQKYPNIARAENKKLSSRIANIINQKNTQKQNEHEKHND